MAKLAKVQKNWNAKEIMPIRRRVERSERNACTVSEMWLCCILALVLCAMVIAKGVLNDRRSPPGPRRLPLLGSLPFLPSAVFNSGGLDVQRLFATLADDFGPVARVGLGPVDAVVLSSPEVLTEAFSKEDVSDRLNDNIAMKITAGSAQASDEAVPRVSLRRRGRQASARRHFERRRRVAPTEEV